jgi:hypothetical protein
MPEPSARAHPAGSLEPAAAQCPAPTGAEPAAPVRPDSVHALLHVIRRTRLLNRAQLNEIKLSRLAEVDDTGVFLDRLCERGWLTGYQAAQLLQGQYRALVLGPYHLLNLVGEGALGQVYKARHLERSCTVAVKVLHAELRASPEILHQFWEEPVALASLGHAAFVRAFDVAPDAAQFYFAMEYVDGIDLAKLLQMAGPLPVAQACDYVRQAALGLQHAYEHGLVHRDIKPSNLLVAFAHAQLRILDIGSARREWRRGRRLNAQAGGALMGTADYIAPEQTTNPQGADTRADVYSLGCTLFHLLTGRVPFPGASLARKLLAHQQTPAPGIRNARPDLPETLEAVVGRMMAKLPADRYQTPALVAVALAPFCEGGGPRLDLEQFRRQGTAPGETLRDARTCDGVMRQEGQAAAWTGAPAACPETPSARGATAHRAEQRSSPRRGGNLIPVLVSDAVAPEVTLRGWVMDRSTGGLGLLVEDALEIGSHVRVRADRSDVPAAWVEVCVIHCCQERIRWRVGCQFLQKPGAGLLSTFG